MQCADWVKPSSEVPASNPQVDKGGVITTVTDEEKNARRARAVMGSVEEVSSRSSKSLTISTVIYLLAGLVAAVAAGVWIASSFEGNGVAVAIAVVGGAVGVFVLSLGARVISDELIRALRQARSDDQSPRA